MKRHQEMITTIIVLGLACAVQTSKSRELPESIEQFAAEQHQQILLQGMEARQAIRYKLKEDYQSHRIAFMESQGRFILGQGEIALASMMEDIRGNGVRTQLGWDSHQLAKTRARIPAQERQAGAAPDATGSDASVVQLDELNAWTQPVAMEATLWPAGAAGRADIGS